MPRSNTRKAAIAAAKKSVYADSLVWSNCQQILSDGKPCGNTFYTIPDCSWTLKVCPNCFITVHRRVFKTQSGFCSAPIRSGDGFIPCFKPTMNSEQCSEHNFSRYVSKTTIVTPPCNTLALPASFQSDSQTPLASPGIASQTPLASPGIASQTPLYTCSSIIRSGNNRGKPCSCYALSDGKCQLHQPKQVPTFPVVIPPSPIVSVVVPSIESVQSMDSTDSGDSSESANSVVNIGVSDVVSASVLAVMNRPKSVLPPAMSAATVIPSIPTFVFPASTSVKPTAKKYVRKGICRSDRREAGEAKVSSGSDSEVSSIEDLTSSDSSSCSSSSYDSNDDSDYTESSGSDSSSGTESDSESSDSDSTDLMRTISEATPSWKPIVKKIVRRIQPQKVPSELSDFEGEQQTSIPKSPKRSRSPSKSPKRSRSPLRSSSNNDCCKTWSQCFHSSSPMKSSSQISTVLDSVKVYTTEQLNERRDSIHESMLDHLAKAMTMYAQNRDVYWLSKFVQSGVELVNLELRVLEMDTAVSETIDRVKRDLKL